MVCTYFKMTEMNHSEVMPVKPVGKLEVELYLYQIWPYSRLPKAEIVQVPSSIYSPIQLYLYRDGLKP